MSLAIGLGFTFFSGATEAWLVDALAATGYHGSLETVLGRGQVAFGAAMLIGTIGGVLLGTFRSASPTSSAPPCSSPSSPPPPSGCTTSASSRAGASR